MMLSQLNLRFHKKLIDALKVRAGRENTSVNALTERFLDNRLARNNYGIDMWNDAVAIHPVIGWRLQAEGGTAK